MCSWYTCNRVRERLTNNPIITYLKVGHVFNLKFPISFKWCTSSSPFPTNGNLVRVWKSCQTIQLCISARVSIPGQTMKGASHYTREQSCHLLAITAMTSIAPPVQERLSWLHSSRRVIRWSFNHFYIHFHMFYKAHNYFIADSRLLVILALQVYQYPFVLQWWGDCCLDWRHTILPEPRNIRGTQVRLIVLLATVS